MTEPIKNVGFFFESRIPVYLLNGHYYAASGWNGEEYLEARHGLHATPHLRFPSRRH